MDISLKWAIWKFVRDFLVLDLNNAEKQGLERILSKRPCSGNLLAAPRLQSLGAESVWLPLAHYSPNAPYNGDEPRKSSPWIPYPAIWAAHQLAIGFKCFRGLSYYVTTEKNMRVEWNSFCLSFISFVSLTGLHSECDFWGNLLFWRSCDIARKEEQRLSAFPQ